MLNSILCVDDNPAANFMNEILLQEQNMCISVTSKESADDAIGYLKQLFEAGLPAPELILLDINMQGKSGWDFLDDLESMDEKFIETIKVVILSSSTSPSDKKKMKSYNKVLDFMNKPISKDVIKSKLSGLVSD